MIEGRDPPLMVDPLIITKAPNGADIIRVLVVIAYTVDMLKVAAKKVDTPSSTVDSPSKYNISALDRKYAKIDWS